MVQMHSSVPRDVACHPGIGLQELPWARFTVQGAQVHV